MAVSVAMFMCPHKVLCSVQTLLFNGDPGMWLPPCCWWVCLASPCGKAPLAVSVDRLCLYPDTLFIVYCRATHYKSWPRILKLRDCQARSTALVEFGKLGPVVALHDIADQFQSPVTEDEESELPYIQPMPMAYAFELIVAGGQTSDGSNEDSSGI